MQMSTLLQDIRFALRLFSKHPGMTAVAVLSLALATGPNAALFSVIDSIFLQDLAVKDLGRLVVIGGIKSGRGDGLSYPDYVDIAEQSTLFSDVVAYIKMIRPVTVDGYEEICTANVVTPNYFTGLGAKPLLGRFFSPERDSSAPEGDPPVVISYRFWQRRFGGRPDVIGRTIETSGRNIIIAGVAPKGFRGMEFHMPIDVWFPMSASEPLRLRRAASFTTRDGGPFELGLGRLRPGATIEQARTELGVIAGRLAESYPATNRGRTFLAESFARKFAIVGIIFGGMALGLVTLVLLIACANVAGLLLAQGEARRKEIAVRLSLGAARRRLVRQFLTESVVLGLAGAAGGILLGYWLMHLPVKPPLQGITFDFGVQFDSHVFAYAVVLSFLAAVMFGLLPALSASKHDLVTAMKSDRGDVPRRARWFSSRNVLVVGQIAVSQFLLAGAVLWVRSYVNIQSVDPGFDANRSVLFAQLAPTAAMETKPFRPESFRTVMERMRAIPGVVEVSGVSAIPLSGSGGGMVRKVLLPGDTEATPVRNNYVGSRFFTVMGVRLLRGRDFTDAEAMGAGKPVIVNQTFARRIAPDGEAVGRWIRVEDVDREVIGIVQDGKYNQLRDSAQAFMFLPAGSPPILAIAAAGNTAGVPDAVRRTLAEVVPQVRVLNFTTLKQTMSFATFVDRLAVGLFGVLGLLGMFLAAVGLYGVVAHSVTRRTHEIGIRIAIGAQPRNVQRMILGHGAKLALVGIPIGLAGAVVAGFAMSRLLYGVAPADPVSYGAGTLVVFGIALLASHLPARKAMRVDPAVALRSE